jgi:ABC-type multidrug transport system ATPase subunit
MKNSEIHLMDEITASLDSQSATQILQALKQCLGKRTRLMISHKLSEVKDFDLIIVLDDGKVIAQGTHDFLLQTCLLYQQLWQSSNNFTSTPKMLQSLGGPGHMDALEPVLMPSVGDELEFKIEDRAKETHELVKNYEPPM